jgi:signal transduction histidine kinase
MPEPPPRDSPVARHGIARRVAALVGAGVLVSTCLVGLVAWRAVRALERRRAADREWVAGVAARSLQDALQRDLAALSALGTSGAFDSVTGDPAPPLAAARALRFHARELSGVFVLDAAGATVAEDPPGAAAALGAQPAEVVPFDRPYVSDAQQDGRVLLAVPRYDRDGRPSGVAGAVVDPGSRGWSAAIGAAAAPGHVVEVVDGHGVRLAGGGATGAPLPADRPVAARAGVEGARWQVLVHDASGSRLGPAGGLLARLALAGAGVLALALLFAWGAARSVIEPLEALSRAAARMADGALHERIPDLGDDQVGRLARAFEGMRQALARSLDDTRRARDELERRVEERTRELERLNQELRVRDQTRGRLLRKVIGAQEEERRRIARELHDQTCQTLAALGMRCQAALGAGESGALRDGLAEARALAQRTLDDVHRVIFDLRPSVLDDLGLFAAIRWVAERHLASQGIAVRCEFDGADDRLPPETETALFRAVQEAVVNVARHARAQNVLIQASRRHDAVEIEIEDDGRGFDAGALATADASGRGLGLLGIRERLDLLGGTAEIDSTPGLGARVVLRAPVPASEALRA